MIGFFTDPYPDEVLYSIVARYHARAKYKKTAFSARDLFNNDAYKIPVDLPSHLNNLIDRLPHGHAYTVDELIDKHTLLPFYQPFIPADRAATVRDCMKSDSKGGAIYAVTGILSYKVYLNGLRYCPECVSEDRRNYGETYWHRPQQLPGVFACGKHALFLNEVTPHPRDIEDRNRYLIVAEQVIKLSEVRPLDLNNPEHEAHYKVALSAEWIASNGIQNEDAFSLNARYRHALFNSRLSTMGGTVNLSKLKDKFSEKYSDSFLETVSCGLSDFKTTWIDRLFQSPKSGQHPVRHFLFIDFCGYSLPEFLKLPTQNEPFGKGPFPCLNPAAEHFKKLVVKEIVIKSKQKSETEIAGNFSCECGYIYTSMKQTPLSSTNFSCRAV